MSALEFAVERDPNPLPDTEREEILANPSFGKHFIDHMVRIDWIANKGWHDAKLQAYGSIEMQLSPSVLYYGQLVFKGLKVHRMPDGSIVTFRPEQNVHRSQRSADRVTTPQLLEETFLEATRLLAEVDTAWVLPAGGEESLYLRPITFSTESTLGVHPSNFYTSLLIASPAGAYFSGGINSVTVWISHEYVRVTPGGTGAAKFVGNHAVSLAAQQQTEEKGCDQVVWLNAVERKYIEEMGGTNLAFIYPDETADAGVRLVTPELPGSLLPGITRVSLLQTAKDLGMNVEECRISTKEWKNDVTSGVMSEAFACGTAVVTTSAGSAKSAKGEFEINSSNTGEQVMKLRERLTGIQHGEVGDTHDWIYKFVEAQLCRRSAKNNLIVVARINTLVVLGQYSLVRGCVLALLVPRQLRGFPMAHELFRRYLFSR